MFFVFNDSSAEALFDEIARRYYRDIYKYCYSRLDFNKEDAEDCTQEAFIVLYKSLPQIKNPDCIAAWLYKTADNFVKRRIAQYGKDKKHLMSYADQSEKDQIENSIAYEENFDLLFEEKVDIEKYMRIILAQLSEKELTLWYLYFKENKSIQDICSVLKISKPSASARIYRLKNKLRRIINKTLEENKDDIYCTKT